MRALVLTSCTGEKAVESDRALTLADFQQGSAHVAKRERELNDALRRAGEMYTGLQHVRLMRGISRFRESTNKNGCALDLYVLSAGYGIISEERKIAPYEVTFATMRGKELRKWADALKVPREFRKLMLRQYDLGLILLGDNYHLACEMDSGIKFGGPTLLLCGTVMAKKLSNLSNVRVIAVSNPEAKRFSCGLVGLKGELAKRLLERVAKEPSLIPRLTNREFDILSWLDHNIRQRDKTNSPKRSEPSPVEPERQRYTVHVPRAKARMKYFIPEWDDRVDPDYDFLNDGITPDRDPYVHDVYAHEIYPSPNYDGILVSKSVIEENKAKKERIRTIGIHRHVRVPRNFPVMGDCGAFNYLDEEIPPFETSETIEFYESLDFDYGVSIDHLILPVHLIRTVHAILTPNQGERRISAEEFERLKSSGLRIAKGRSNPRDLFENEPFLVSHEEKDYSEGKRRWRITFDNSKDFIQKHRAKGCRFTPVAGCQGYNVESQVEMFKEQQAMGYGYIALGGLVRSKTADILEVIEGVNRIRKPGVKIHLFGIARPEAIQALVVAGIDSVDSARFLRQAWLSATSNYYTGDVNRFIASMRPKRQSSAANEDEEQEVDEQWRYAAIRVPPLQSEGVEALTAKASKLLAQGWTLENLRDEETKSLEALRAFDRGNLDLDATLETVLAYDQLMGGDVRNAPHYRRLLEDKPWRSCPCAVCKQTGIDVVIFRRNNRNRRRGFHNTWWFFRLFSKLTDGSGA